MLLQYRNISKLSISIELKTTHLLMFKYLLKLLIRPLKANISQYFPYKPTRVQASIGAKAQTSK